MISSKKNIDGMGKKEAFEYVNKLMRDAKKKFCWQKRVDKLKDEWVLRFC